MGIATGLNEDPGFAGKATYTLRFGVQKSEVNLSKEFQLHGATLGAAASRGNTSLAVSHAHNHHTFFVTDTNQLIDLPLSDKLIDTSKGIYSAETEGQPELNVSKDVGPYVLINDRTRINVVSSRLAVGINGTLGSTLSGTASVKLLDLFETVDAGEVVPGTTGRAPRPNIAFTQIPVRYPNWTAINATYGVCQPQVIRTCNGQETPVSPLFFTPAKMQFRISKVQPLVKKIYDAAWALTETAPFPPEKKLHKSVMMERDAGLDGCGFTIAAAVNDTPPALNSDVAESLMSAALSNELQDHHILMLEALSVPSVAATAMYGGEIATALSAVAAYAMPYRVDGTPMSTPEGLKMFQSEAWPTGANDDTLRRLGDCEDQANFANHIIVQASTLMDAGADMRMYPNLRAVANSLGAHYVHGTTVIAANAGHADAADESATAIAGHAIVTLIPKTSFAVAMQKGSKAKIAGAFVVDPQFESAVTSARWESLYPKSLLEKMPEAEQRHFASYETARQLSNSTMTTGLQPLAIEGTTFASSKLFEHDDIAREARQEAFADTKKSLGPISPNILRMFKTLDVGESGEHAFYNSVIEQSFSTKHKMFTSGPLRSMNAACCHVRYVHVSPAGDVTSAGASPKDLATGNYAIVPLWTIDVADGALLDEALDESMSNTLPPRGRPISVDSEIFEANIAMLQSIDAFFHEDGKQNVKSDHHQALVSFASLVGNKNAIADIAALLKTDPNIRGEVFGLDKVINGLAVDPTGREMGRYIVLELELPRK
tara:strand:+ start:1940 stop:4261 length:2322 start_codon:yes stop_codon:yes gene_type:complete